MLRSHVWRIAAAASLALTAGAIAVATVGAQASALCDPAACRSFEAPTDSGTFVVPVGVTELTVTLDGAAGGSAMNHLPGGHGGELTARVSVQPGQVLDIVSGGRGADGGFFNDPNAPVSLQPAIGGGGTAGYTDDHDGFFRVDGGGGGGSFLFDDATGDLLLAAGGGGGAGGGEFGGDGGAAQTAVAGHRGSDAFTPGVSGTGGTADAGGLAGGDVSAGTTGSGPASLDALQSGGFSGGAGSPDAQSGGGGGGYFGGGGGGLSSRLTGGLSDAAGATTAVAPADTPTGGGAGGGGSGYLDASAVFVRAGSNPDRDGSVTISWVPQAATVSQAQNTLTVDPQPTGAVTLTSSLNYPGAEGTVEFYDGTVALGSAPLQDGQAVFTTEPLDPGAHAFGAVFTASDGDSATSDSLPFTAPAASTTASPTSTPTAAAPPTTEPTAPADDSTSDPVDDAPTGSDDPSLEPAAVTALVAAG